jgi:phosphohistidine swiveling domain-containing protein
VIQQIEAGMSGLHRAAPRVPDLRQAAETAALLGRFAARGEVLDAGSGVVYRQGFEATSGNREQRPDGDVLDGIAASPGRYTGPVRVIMDESHFDRLRPGDVMVCPITSPVWSVLFPSVGALVTDTGGVLSHPAIIAREYRMPAVVATGNATALLHDDQTVTVDGTAGRIEVGS